MSNEFFWDSGQNHSVFPSLKWGTNNLPPHDLAIFSVYWGLQKGNDKHLSVFQQPFSDEHVTFKMAIMHF